MIERYSNARRCVSRSGGELLDLLLQDVVLALVVTGVARVEAALLVDDEGGGDGVDAEGLRRLLLTVDERRDLDGVAREVVLDGAGVLARDEEDLDLVAELALQAVELGDLGLARAAPR